MPRHAKASVLVTNAEQRSTLAACRGLASAGYRTAVIDIGEGVATRWSRACDEVLAAPNPLNDPLGFVERVVDRLRERRYDAMLFATDAALVAASEYRGFIEPLTRLGLPPHESVLRSLDKLSLLEWAADAGLPPPPTIICESQGEAHRAAAELGFPVGIKPARSLVKIGPSMRQRTMTVVEDEARLSAILPNYGLPVTLQRFENVLSILSCSGAIAEEAMLALTMARARRTYPPTAGSFCFSETIEPLSEIVDKVIAVLRETGWQGIFQVDLLETNERTSLIDLNPRLFSSMGLDIRAGVNLPAIWCDWLLGRDPIPVRARPGYRYRWEEGELRHLFWQLRRRRIPVAATMLRPHRRTEHAFLSLSDPGPFLFQALSVARRAARKARWVLRRTY